MDRGNEVRKKLDGSALAQAAIWKIRGIRESAETQETPIPKKGIAKHWNNLQKYMEIHLEDNNEDRIITEDMADYFSCDIVCTGGFYFAVCHCVN